MVKVNITSTFFRGVQLIPATGTVREVLAQAGIDSTAGLWSLGGHVLAQNEFDCSFATLGIGEETTLTCVQKQDNA